MSLAFIFGGFILVVKLVYWSWWRDARIDEKRLVYWSVQGVTAVTTWRGYNEAVRGLWSKLPTTGEFAFLDMAINRRLFRPSGPVIRLRTEDFNKHAKIAFEGAYLEQAEFCVPQDGSSLPNDRAGVWETVYRFREEAGFSILPPTVAHARKAAREGQESSRKLTRHVPHDQSEVILFRII